MRVHVAGETWSGRAIDFRRDGGRGGDCSVSDVATAIRGDSAGLVTAECPDPGPAHGHVGVIRAETTLSLRPALAAAARSRGHEAPQADELAAVRDRLATLEPPEIDLERARRRVAEASDTETELRERVATLRGRVQALREVSDVQTPDSEVLTSDAAETELADATRRLSEVETERIAAEQALASARERAREHRADRRERLRLQDRAGNLRRAAREYLAETVRDRFADARDALPDAHEVANEMHEDAPDCGLADDPIGSALAVARVAELDAPVVIARDVGPFESAGAAARWLDAPVVRV